MRLDDVHSGWLIIPEIRLERERIAAVASSERTGARPAGRWRRPGRALVAWFGLFGRALWRAFVKFIWSDDMTHAAAVAYYGLLSLFPFFLLLFSILGGLTSTEDRRTTVINFLLPYFPTKFDFLSAQLDALQQTRYRIGVGGAVAMLWAAHGVFSAVSSAVNSAWGVEKPRSFWRHKLFSFLMLVAAAIGLLLLLLIGSVFQIVHSTWFSDATWRTPGIAALGTFFLDYGTTILLTVGIGLIFYFVPNTKVRFRDVWPGAFLTGLLWQVALKGFSLYLRDMSRFNLVHGSIAAVVVFLVWVYTSSAILLYGVEFTAAYARLLREPGDRRP
jgi:membrane protein